MKWVCFDQIQGLIREAAKDVISLAQVCSFFSFFSILHFIFWNCEALYSVVKWDGSVFARY